MLPVMNVDPRNAGYHHEEFVVSRIRLYTHRRWRNPRREAHPHQLLHRQMIELYTLLLEYSSTSHAAGALCSLPPRDWCTDACEPYFQYALPCL